MTNLQVTSSQSDEELVSQARQGDHGAFQQLVERYESQVAGTVVGMLGPGPDADDVGQETFIRFYDALERFRGESAVGTYLTRIAINLSLNAIKRRKWARLRFWSLDEEDEERRPSEPSVDGQAAVDEEAQKEVVGRAIQELKPDHRAVVVLRMIEGYSTRETAELLGVAQGTVLSRLSRGMASLKSILQTGMGYYGE